MNFRSILFGGAEIGRGCGETPELFGDLNLDLTVTAVIAGREEYTRQLHNFAILEAAEPVIAA